MNNEYVSPTIITTASKMIKLLMTLFFNKIILLGKKFLNIMIHII